MNEYIVSYLDKEFIAIDSSKRNIFASDLNDAAEKYFSMLSNREAIVGVRVESVGFFGKSDWIANPNFIKGFEAKEPIFKDQNISKDHSLEVGKSSIQSSKENATKEIRPKNRSFSKSFAYEPEKNSIQIEYLRSIYEVQTKQLYWIRIIGIPFMFAAIGTILKLLFG